LRELQFIDRRQSDWQAWDRWLAAPPKAAADAAGLDLASLPHRFRTLCRDLALARDRQYSAHLVDELHRRVLAAHQRIYGAPAPRGSSVWEFLGGGFPAQVRREWRLVIAAALLFFLPLLLMIAVAQAVPEAVYLVLSPEQAGQFQEMYSPEAKHLGRPRSAASEWAMWGHYIANNVRIDFQCFAGGLAFGVGAVFFLLYNGLMIGAVAGHLTQLGHIETFWGFVAGHSAFELTGAVLSGAAGLRLGLALLAPGRLTRGDALKQAARQALGLIYGAALLTFLAAFIEAFWSPQRGIPFGIKIGAGLFFWLLTWGYLLLAGRGRHAH
jgi:uncharacterized membrane protein SpoIIM required for sporulation